MHNKTSNEPFTYCVDQYGTHRFPNKSVCALKCLIVKKTKYKIFFLFHSLGTKKILKV